MQKPNAPTNYQQNPIERLLLRPGWRFLGLQLFSTAPWKSWAFVTLSITTAAILLFLFGNEINTALGLRN